MLSFIYSFTNIKIVEKFRLYEIGLYELKFYHTEPATPITIVGNVVYKYSIGWIVYEILQSRLLSARP